MELKIMFQFARLIAAIALEGLTGVGHLMVFLLRRQDCRGRIHALILGQAPRPRAIPVTAIVALLPVLALAGCVLASCGSTESTEDSSAYRSSFQKQLDEVGYSAEFLFGMKGSRESFQEDLETFTDHKGLEELYSSMEFFLWAPDARTSMESDLGEFGRAEPGALRETFELWGW